MNKLNLLTVFCALILGLFTSFSQTFTINNGSTGSQTFNSNGTVVVSAGVTATVTVQLWSGGNAGGNNLGAGGAGGRYSSTNLTLTGAAGTGTSYAVVVGAGGTPPGGTGGTSSLFTATLGGGGGASGGAAAVNKAGGGGGEGGCSTGTATVGGPGDQGGGPNGTGGAGGSGCDGGDGGTGGVSGSNGLPGAVPGGGGGGAGSGAGAVGGVGAAGRVIVTIISALPVELISFDVNSMSNSNQLSWVTASELNNEKFEIYRAQSSSSVQEKIGEVVGNGTTQEVQHYTFIDNEISTGVDYCYQLKQIDYDGVYEYSDMSCTRSKNESSSVAIYPNPFTDNIVVVAPEQFEGLSADLLSAQGEVLTSVLIVGLRPIIINTSNLKSGLYYLKAGSSVSRIIKN